MSGIQSVSVNASTSYASVGTQSRPSLQSFSNLNLSEAQRTQIRAIFQSAKQQGSSPSAVQAQIQSILTPAQQQAFSADTAGKPGHHHGGHHRGGGGPAGSQNASSPATNSSTSTPATAAQLSLGLTIDGEQ